MKNSENRKNSIKTMKNREKLVDIKRNIEYTILQVTDLVIYIPVLWHFATVIQNHKIKIENAMFAGRLQSVFCIFICKKQMTKKQWENHMKEKRIGKIKHLLAGLLCAVLLTGSLSGVKAAESVQNNPEAETETEQRKELTDSIQTLEKEIRIELEELTSYNKGDLSAEDTELGEDIGKDHQVTTSKEYEPDVSIGKAAKWINIEKGIAELTLTQKDSSDWSDNPSDYIIVLDRTVSMVVDYTSMYGNPQDDLGFASSVCLNPEHYYQYQGQKVRLIDYGHGYYVSSGKYFSTESYMGNLEEIWKEHYDASGKKIAPRVANHCIDRLMIAQNSIKDILDVLEQQNQTKLAGGIKNRVMYWSFSGSNDWNNGLWNEVPEFTEDMAAVKKAVKYEAYPGTYYYRSFEQILNKLKEKQKDTIHKDIPTKVIFISDGILYDKNPDEVTKLANQIKKMENTKIYTILIGDSKDSEAGKVLMNYATSPDCFATVTNDWNGFVNTMTAIQKDQFEIKATEKVVTDRIETKYWEVQGDPVLEEGNGTARFDEDKTVLTWNLPETSGKTYTCKVRLKLKDEYRYLVSDTSYPTNADEESADEAQISEDPSKAGGSVSYQISGGKYHGETRTVGVKTPDLKYGTVAFQGTKYWTVKGSEADAVKIRLKRTMPGSSEQTEINNVTVNTQQQWKYSFNVRRLPDGTTYPLIRYNNAGQEIAYQVMENVPDFYIKTDETKAEKDGVITTDFYNEPLKVKVQVKKVDQISEHPLSGAEFSVYAWSSNQGTYVPYQGTQDSVNGAAVGMKLEEKKQGIYESPTWLYYSSDNCGKFKLIETKAPEGYVGDWKDDSKMESVQDKKEYEFQISKDPSQNEKMITVSNREDGAFGNQRVTGKISVTKEGEFLTDAKRSLTDQLVQFVKTKFEYLLGRVENVTFAVYTGEDIFSPDGSGAFATRINSEEKEIVLKENTLVDLIVTNHQGIAELENLPLGTYYIKEISTGTQGNFLLNREIREVNLIYAGEGEPVVHASDMKVMEAAEIYYVNERRKVEITLEKYERDAEGKKTPVAGALFGLYAAEDLWGYEVETDGSVQEKAKIVISKGMLIETAESDSKGMVEFTADLPCAKYEVKEIKAPDGYLKNQQIFTVDASKAENEDENLKFHFEAENVKTQVRIRKTDLLTGEPVSGAKMCVLEKETEEKIAEWITDGTEKLLEGLKLSGTEEHIYVLRELDPPAGYVTAADLEFKLQQNTEAGASNQQQILIMEQGKWKVLEENSIEMKDDITKVEIRKGNQKTKKLMDGAKLELRDSNGKIWYSWISSKEQGFYIERLPIGTYRIVETEKMEGYVQANPLVIKVIDTDQKQVFTFENRPEEKTEVPVETPKTPVPKTAEAVKTGDYAPILLCMVMLAGSLAGLSVGRKNRKR